MCALPRAKEMNAPCAPSARPMQEVCVGTVFSDGSWGQVMQTVNTKDANDLYVSQLCTP